MNGNARAMVSSAFVHPFEDEDVVVGPFWRQGTLDLFELNL